MKIIPIKREEELFQLFQSLPAPGTTLHCVRGESVFLISHGELNHGPGPDFLNAVLLIDGQLSVGPVEMHLREADWFAHKHHHDPAYQGVVLHVLADNVEPEELRLAMPTVTAHTLQQCLRYKEADEEKLLPSNVGLSLDLLAEYSWARLLRRSTEILREGGADSAKKVEAAFLVRLFDSLGYSRNREPMKAVAHRLLAVRSRLYGISFDQTLAVLFSVAGIPAERLEKVGKIFMAEERLKRVLPVADVQTDALLWDYRGRPANAPERRLWAGAKLVFDYFQNDLLEGTFSDLRKRSTANVLRRYFLTRLGTESILGGSRADEIVVNVLCPVALAAGILRQDLLLIEGACLAYRTWPALASNKVVREVEKRFAENKKLDGAFFQQGAIEYYQRVLSPDRSGYSMIAEERLGQRDEGRGMRAEG